MSGKKTDLDLIAKENLVVYMRRVEGKRFETIAKELGYANASGPQKAYERAIKRIKHPDSKEYFGDHIERLDALIETYTQPAINGNLRSAEYLLRVMQQQADMMGLNAPTYAIQEVITHNGPRSLNDEVTELARVIDYIEGVAAEITTIPGKSQEGEQIEMDGTGENRTITS